MLKDIHSSHPSVSSPGQVTNFTTAERAPTSETSPKYTPPYPKAFIPLDTPEFWSKELISVPNGADSARLATKTILPGPPSDCGKFRRRSSSFTRELKIIFSTSKLPLLASSSEIFLSNEFLELKNLPGPEKIFFTPSDNTKNGFIESRVFARKDSESPATHTKKSKTNPKIKTPAALAAELRRGKFIFVFDQRFPEAVDVL